MYFNGEYVKQSDKETLIWLTFSAESGNALAQVRLGNFYREGASIVPKDYKKALYWYYEDAKQNDGAGLYYLGVCYYYGYGFAKNTIIAKYWMEKSLEHKYDAAASFLKRSKF
jgi:TPR repeat protein